MNQNTNQNSNQWRGDNQNTQGNQGMGQNNNSIFNEEPFNSQFRGFSEAKVVKEASFVDSDDTVDNKDNIPSGIPPKMDHEGKPEKSVSPIWNIAGIVVIVLLLIGISNSVAEKRESAKEESGDVLTAEQIEQLASVIFTDNEDGGNIASDTALVDRSNVGRPNNTGTPSYSLIENVRLAVLDEGRTGAMVRGCDSVYFVNQAISPTRAPLNSALQELFKRDIQTEYEPGNFLATQEKLSFINATIDAGIARVYLTGEVGPYEDGCDQKRAFIQIEETTKQFGTVRAVEIYLDGKKLSVN